MTSNDGVAHTQKQVDDAVAKGAQLLCGGKRPEIVDLPGGYFYEPTAVTNVRPDMAVMNEETFGPLVGIDTFHEVDEALKKANSTRYGLVSYVYTNDLRTAFKMMEGIQSGTVAINNISPDSPMHPIQPGKTVGLVWSLAALVWMNTFKLSIAI